jgi:nitroreductase/NAD-dependent dihydropyrimidine dehydrogenase PreA subunit
MKRKVNPPNIVLQKCIGCKLCVEECPSFVLEMRGERASVIRADWCIGCGHCGAVCPVEAVLHEATSYEKIILPGPSAAISPESLQLLIRERRSVRIYVEEEVPEESLKKILNAGRYAPTGTNSQNVSYIVLRSPDQIEKLRKMTMHFYEKIFSWVRSRVGRRLLTLMAGRTIVETLQESLPKVDHAKKLMEQGQDRLFFHAPVLILAHAESWDTCSAFNCSVALYNCSLMAHTLGIGCCFNGYLVSAVNKDRDIKRWLGIPKDHKCYAAMTLGHQKMQYQRVAERRPPEVAWR